MKKTYFLDTECYPNYFLILFKDEKGNEISFELTKDSPNLDVASIKSILANNTTVGFNSRFYDLPMIMFAFGDRNNAMLKHLSDKLISDDNFDTISDLSLWPPYEYDHIDIINVAIGKASLKMYGARINTPFLQDLPYDPSNRLSKEQMLVLKKYCSNDIDITMSLYNYLKNDIEIRKSINVEYGVDVRSRSDAQIAEVLIRDFVRHNIENKVKEYDFKYKAPSYINFITDPLIKLFEDIKEIRFKVTSEDKLIKDNVLSSVTINERTYSLGIGGIHSTESNRKIIANDDEYLIDVDVTSYYPSIILNNGYAPESFKQSDFIEFYKDIYDQRLEAKKKGDKTKANVFKIILNGSFGKFGNKYSLLYSPKLLIHTTITGQLSILMLIEDLEEQGFNVVSSNTDGITVHFKKSDYDKFKTIVSNWEQKTNFKTEETRYKALYNQSVNSYIAVKTDNSLKCKGIFASDDISRNPAIKICKEAIFAYLINVVPIEYTIKKAELNPINFLMVRRVTTGGYFKGDYLGKVVRWYWSTKGEHITNKKGDKVANTDDAYPIMDLRDKIEDLHYDKYIAKTYALLETIGVNNG
jgi:DNA polymerase elongation subunit (family B)